MFGKKVSSLVLLASLTLAACANPNGGSTPDLNKSTVGAVLGGVGGGVAGSAFGKGKGQVAAAVAGSLLGAFLGSEVGKSLDQADALYAQRNAQYALETQPVGSSAGWRNPDSGNAGTITPTRTYTTAQNQPCREFEQTVTIGTQKQKAYGTACRQADGSWQIQQ
jgi:surface antigen